MATINEKDKELECIDCGDKFWWTEKEQQFYAEKGFSQPKRCVKCRAIKKQAAQRGR